MCVCVYGMRIFVFFFGFIMKWCKGSKEECLSRACRDNLSTVVVDDKKFEKRNRFFLVSLAHSHEAVSIEQLPLYALFDFNFQLNFFSLSYSKTIFCLDTSLAKKGFCHLQSINVAFYRIFRNLLLSLAFIGKR